MKKRFLFMIKIILIKKDKSSDILISLNSRPLRPSLSLRCFFIIVISTVKFAICNNVFCFQCRVCPVRSLKRAEVVLKPSGYAKDWRMRLWPLLQGKYIHIFIVLLIILVRL